MKNKNKNAFFVNSKNGLLIIIAFLIGRSNVLRNNFLFASSKSLSCTRLWHHRFTSTQAESKDEEYHSIIKNTERGKGQYNSCYLLIHKQIV